MTATTIDPILSDLFFNHEHPVLDAMYAGLDKNDPAPTWEEIEAAIKKDATEFVANYGAALCYVPDIDELVADYMHRR